MTARDQLANPYESPHTRERKHDAKPFLTRRRVFWSGLGGIAAALTLVNVRYVLIVQPLQRGGAWDFAEVAVDVFAEILFFGGILALIVYHWFPDPTRKYSWRRRNSNDPGPTDL